MSSSFVSKQNTSPVPLALTLQPVESSARSEIRIVDEPSLISAERSSGSS
ncbi:hypothetical protein Hanom_Chr08g00750011 [Helianthus anomalus]